MSKLLGMKQKNLRSGHHAKAPARSPKAPARKSSRPPRPALKIPPILFESDQPGQPVAAGAGEKFALGPGLPPAQKETQGRHLPEVHGKENERLEKAQEARKAELPEAYGTGKVLLLAREPHGLYAHWDLTR